MQPNLNIDLQSFITYSEDTIGIFDTDFKLISCTKKLVDIFYQTDQINLKVGDVFSEVLPSEKKSFWSDLFLRAINGEKVRNEFQYIGTTGKCIDMENCYSPILQDGKVVAVIQCLKLFSHRNNLLETVNYSEKTYKHLASNIPNSDLFLLDEDFNIIIASGTDLKNRGYNPEDLVGRNMYEVVADFGFKLLWEYYDKARMGIDSQVEFNWDNDYYLDDIIPLRDDFDVVNGYIIFSRKVTQQKLIEKKLEDINQSKDNILGIVAHDLRNPITAILGLADLIKNDPKNSEKYFELIDRSCKSALTIITELLDISELDKSDFTLQKEKIELVEFLKGIIQSNTILANDKELEIDFISNVSNILVEINEAKFSRVINNLLVNAIKFSHRKEKILVSLDLHPDQSSVIIKVQDRGIGVPDSLKSIIFEKFTKASRKGTEGENSLGLGMSIVKKIVELHCGKIWLESKENEGSTVFIELPLPKIIQNANA